MCSLCAAWRRFFDRGNVTMQYSQDSCSEAAHGGNGLPCTQVSNEAQRCPHWAPPAPAGPLSTSCEAALAGFCHNVRADPTACATCVHSHGLELKAAGCPKHPASVVAEFCQNQTVPLRTVLLDDATAARVTGTGPPHHVCDLSLPPAAGGGQLRAKTDDSTSPTAVSQPPPPPVPPVNLTTYGLLGTDPAATCIDGQTDPGVQVWVNKDSPNTRWVLTLGSVRCLHTLPSPAAQKNN